jgi:hypothetical protein
MPSYTSSTVNGGSYSEHQITNIAGSVFTISPVRPSNTATDAVVAIDAVRSIYQAKADEPDGTVLYFPDGDYNLYRIVYMSDADDNITFRGQSATGTRFLVSSGGQGFSSSGVSSAFTDERIVLGTAPVKGTSTLELANLTNCAPGVFVNLVYANEENSARIQAGAVPTWTQKGYPQVQQLMTRITAVTIDPDGGGPLNGSITVDPPVPMDATYRSMKVALQPYGWGASIYRVGFEDLGFYALDGVSFGWGIVMGFFEECWVYKCRTISSGNRGYWMTNSYKCEIKKCYLGETVGYSSDGLIGWGATVKCLVMDNIGKDGNILVYDDGNSWQNAILYNYTTNVGDLYLGHNTHPCINLIEGNVTTGYYKADGYHGNSSHNTIYRNHIQGVILNRFVRKIVIAGNIIGTDGTSGSFLSYGNPNMGNGSADGFAGPSGLSTQAGTYDYLQVDYPGFYVYQIQPSDIFAGDFWADWQMTGVVTNKLNDSECVVTMDSTTGQMFLTQGQAEGNGPSLMWSSRTLRRDNMYVDAISGLNVTLKSSVYAGGSAVPANGTPVVVWAGTHGFQERDLDVQVYTTLADNYHSSAGGTGAVGDLTSDTLPTSLAYSATPSWWPGSLTYPPINPDAPNFGATIIPAGYRYVNGTEPPSEAPVNLNVTNYGLGTLRVGG